MESLTRLAPKPQGRPTVEATDTLDALARMVAGARRLLVLTGAGCSTESGIPDYRNAEGSWKSRRPMLYREFVGSATNRRRY